MNQLESLIKTQARVFKPFIQELMTGRFDQADFDRKEKKENWEDWNEANQPKPKK